MAARARTAVAGVLVCVAAACGGSPAPDPVKSSEPSSRAASVGELIDAAIAADTSDAYHALRAILVTVDGKAVATRYYRSSPASTWDIESAGKTIMR